jgi:gamma-glutamyl hercynylcysteine S-oxide synthase
MWQPWKWYPRRSVILLLSLVSVGLGCCSENALSMNGGAVGVCYLLGMTPRASDPASREKQGGNPVTIMAPPAALPAVPPAVDRPHSDDPIENIVGQSRYALLLRRQVVGSLSRQHLLMAIDTFQQGMAFVPEGDVAVKAGMEFVDEEASGGPADRSHAGCLIHVGPFFLDRWPVTNRQYYEFVVAGGYGDMALWDPRILPAVLEMVDQTGLPGPRFWRNGCYSAGEEDLPVVGIGWYEAAACARWLGKRLPSDAEWVKATAWPVAIDAKTLIQRRYPWGDAMDRALANIWGSGPGCVVPVRAFAEGASVGGIYQLIGNVWQWTDGDFCAGANYGKLELPTPMKSIRGGAFDTYFDTQVSADFRSGENPLSRRHNIGFRCAIGMHDVVLGRADLEAPEAGAAMAEGGEART